MRIANLAGRLVLIEGDHALDVESASEHRFGADPAPIFGEWDALVDWARDIDVTTHPDAVTFAAAELGAPSPRPRQVIGVGLNYADHAAEAGLPIPEHPVVFTKFASSITGPDVDVRLPGDTVDWEAELVVVIGRGGRDIPESEAVDRIAGYTVGQDLSERTVQWQGHAGAVQHGQVLRELRSDRAGDRVARRVRRPRSAPRSRRRSSVRTAPRRGCRTAPTTS